jgi:hypothetical protein
MGEAGPTVAGASTIRWTATLTGVGVAALFLVLFRESLLPGRLPADVVPASDVTYVGVVYEQAAAQVRAGRLPLWFHEFAAGNPLAAAWMYGLLYPGALLFAALPLGSAFAWTCALHVGLGAAGMTLFLRRRGCDAAGAVGGALLFAVSEYFVGRSAYGHVNLVMPVAWAPWVLRFLDGCAKGERRAAPLLAIVGGAGLLAGHVQTWVILGPLLVAFAASEAWTSADRAGAMRRMALGGALAFGVCAVQIAITGEFLARAATAVETPDLVFKASAPPLVVASKFLWGWIGPDPSPDKFDYRPDYRGIAGLWAFGLAAWAVARRAPAWRLWTTFAVVGLVASIGMRSPLTAWLQEVPPFSLARVPARFMILPLVCVSILAGHGIALLPWKPAARLAATAAASLLAVTLGTPGVRSIEGALHSLDWTKRIPARCVEHRVLAPLDVYYWSNIQAGGVRSFNMPCYVPTRALAEFMDPPSPAIFWWLDMAANVTPTLRPDATRPYQVSDLVRVNVQEVPAMGSARFFSSAETNAPHAEVLARLRAGERTLFLDVPGAAPTRATSDAMSAASATASWAPSEVRVAIDCDGPGWVLVSTPSYPGWTCTVDGAPTPIVRANVVLSAVAVGAAGRHEVVMRYEPDSFRIGAAVSLASLAAAVALLVVGGRKLAASSSDAPKAT